VADTRERQAQRAQTRPGALRRGGLKFVPGHRLGALALRPLRTGRLGDSAQSSRRASPCA
jgi:hypothetical protein